MKIKVVYIVSGSEDGILGVFGNKKGAHKEALHYVNKFAEKNNIRVATYNNICNELKNVYNHSIDMIDDYRSEINATITAVPYNLNSIWTN